MPIPDYESLMLPVLRACADGQEHQMRDITQRVAESLRISQEEMKEVLPSGNGFVFSSRVSWAKTYLGQAGLLRSPRRAWVQITDRGRTALKEVKDRLDNSYLVQFAEFRDFQKRSRTAVKGTEKTAVLEPEKISPPEKDIEEAYARLREQLVEDVLAAVRECSDRFFEKLVIDLLLAMGYGGSKRDAGKHLGKTGDGGIDGIIKEDRLGLDVIYLQAKRWKEGSSVGAGDMRNFIGALSTNNARKGVFLTTSDFARPAREAAEKAAGLRIILLNGREIASLMIDFNVGVGTAKMYEVKQVDSDFFVEES